MQYSIKKLAIFNICALLHVSQILKECGDDMYNKYQLTHWKNSNLKTFMIVVYTALRHTVYGVFNESHDMVATFQTKCHSDGLHFSKLAVMPGISGKGIGSYCLKEMENIANNKQLPCLRCEVYDKSKHAYDFYIKRGFTEVGKIETLKYTELVLEKRL